MNISFKLFFTLVLCSSNFLFAQSGPGGVGTAATNPLWLQADDISQTNGSAVSNWSDRSGNGNDASQAIVNYQPSYITSALNGRSVVRLDGDNDHLDDPRTYSARTFFSVYNIMSSLQATSDLGQIWGSYSEGFHVALDARGGAKNYSFDGAPGLNSGNLGKYELNGAAYGSFGKDPNTPNWVYNQYDLVAVEFNITRSLTRQTLGSLIPHFNVGDHQFGGDIAEVIVYNNVLNDAQRIIVENFLAARYKLTISNDKYAYETVYGNEVAGIGRIDATNNHLDAQGTSLVRINSATSLNDGDYLLWGHNSVDLHSGAYQAPWTGGLPAGVNNSLHRLWRVDETGDVGNVNVQIDVSSLSIGASSNLVLLIDSDDGDFANATVVPLSNFTAPYANFNGVNFSAGNWFTLGSTSGLNSLPIELINFNAQLNTNTVELNWQTASEINNDYFSIQRSVNGEVWETISVMNGAGNSTSLLSYAIIDSNPFYGKSYYRLKQTDFNGDYSYSQIQIIDNESSTDNKVVIYPNPTSDLITIIGSQNEMKQVTILNSLGQDVGKITNVVSQDNTTWTVDLSNLGQGVYFIRTKTGVTKVYKQ